MRHINYPILVVFGQKIEKRLNLTVFDNFMKWGAPITDFLKVFSDSVDMITIIFGNFGHGGGKRFIFVLSMLCTRNSRVGAIKDVVSEHYQKYFLDQDFLSVEMTGSHF